VGTPLITFEYAVFLLSALWRGDAGTALHRLRAADPTSAGVAVTARYLTACEAHQTRPSPPFTPSAR